MENEDEKAGSAAAGPGTPEFKFVGVVDEQPEPEPKAKALQTKVVEIKAMADTTTDEWSNYAVGIVNPDTGEFEEYLVPRNAVKLLSALQSTVDNKGEAYADARVTVSKMIPQPGQDGQPVAVRLQLIDAKLSDALVQVRDIMIASPEAAYRAMRVNAEPVLESSDCIFMDVLLFFRSKGVTGETLRTPYFEMCHDDALKYYNALCAHAELFKLNMKREGIDLDAKQIITTSGGFNAKKSR